jgi:hypothetical protein
VWFQESSSGRLVEGLAKAPWKAIIIIIIIIIIT